MMKRLKALMLVVSMVLSVLLLGQGLEVKASDKEQGDVQKGSMVELIKTFSDNAPKKRERLPLNWVNIVSDKM